MLKPKAFSRCLFILFSIYKALKCEDVNALYSNQIESFVRIEHNTANTCGERISFVCIVFVCVCWWESFRIKMNGRIKPKCSRQLYKYKLDKFS